MIKEKLNKKEKTMSDFNNNNSLVTAGNIFVNTSKSGKEYFKVDFFGRASWNLLLSDKYNSSLNDVNNGDTTYYKSTHMIPYGTVYKGSQKIAKSFLRENNKGSYLMIIAPVGGSNGRKMRKYFIFDLDSNNKPTNDSEVVFDVSGDYWNN